MALVTRGFAFGLTWYTSTSDGRDEIKLQAKRLKANVFAEAVYEQSRMYGFGEVKKSKGVRAAAAAVAESLPDGGIFLQRIDADGTTCLIAVDPERRLPVPGLDVVGPRTTMIGMAKKYIAENASREIKLYGDMTADEFPPPQFSIPHSLAFERVAQDAVITGELKRLNQIDGRWLLVPVVVLGLGAVFYSDEITDLIAPQSAKPAQSLEAQYRNQVKDAINQVVQLNQFPSNVMAGFSPFLQQVPGKAAGWRLESLTCADTDCTAIWHRGPGATSEGLLQALNISATDPTIKFYDIDYAKRQMRFVKGTETKKLLLVPNATFSKLVGSWMQGLADQGHRPTQSQLIPLISVNGAKLGAGDVPQFGTYSFTVPFNEGKLREVANLPDMLTIEGITIKGEGENKMTVTFNGKYYAL